MKIIVSKDGKDARSIDPSKWRDEAELQQYIADNPDVVPLTSVKEDLRLLVIRKEFVLAEGERLDVLAVDRDGDLYIIETKLFTNADKRRVIAQVLDYGAALWKGYGDGRAFLEAVERWLSHDGDQRSAIRSGRPSASRRTTSRTR